MHALNDALALDWDHFSKQAFRALGCSPPQVALSTFSAYQLPRSRQTEALGGSFMGL